MRNYLAVEFDFWHFPGNLVLDWSNYMPLTHNRPRRPRSLVGTFHAKTHFSQLIERVQKGEEITITKHHKPVARLVPADRPLREHVAKVFRQMDVLRKSIEAAKPQDKTNLKDLINEGRRF